MPPPWAIILVLVLAGLISLNGEGPKERVQGFLFFAILFGLIAVAATSGDSSPTDITTPGDVERANCIGPGDGPVC